MFTKFYWYFGIIFGEIFELAKDLIEIKNQKKIPAFAMTEEQMEKYEDEECDELLNFMDNLDADKFIEDLELKNQLDTLKKKVDFLAPFT